MEDVLNFGDIIFSPKQSLTTSEATVFADKVYIVTGASSGIGEAIARALVKHGARVVLASRNQTRLKQIRLEIEQKNNQCLVVKTDVTSEAACTRLINLTIAHFGQLDGLINNAGISMRARFDEVDIKVLKQLMDTNFWGAVYCTKAALPYLIKSHGTLVAISSILWHHTTPRSYRVCRLKTCTRRLHGNS